MIDWLGMFHRVFDRWQIGGSIQLVGSRSLSVALALFATVACGSEPAATQLADDVGGMMADDSSSDTGGSDEDAGQVVPVPGFSSCSPEKNLGGFLIQLDEGFTQVEGQVFDSANPRQKTVESEADDCQLLIEPQNFCDPPCAPADACGAGDQCVPRPLAVPVGTVTVQGLSADVTMKPGPTNFYLNVKDLPHPGFAPDAQIQLSASGGDWGEFTLISSGISPYAMTEKKVAVTEGEPVTLSWATASSSDSARVIVSLDIGHHGGSSATIECVTDDDGAFEIHADLIDQLIGYGVAGFPIITVARQSIVSKDVFTGCVELVVSSAPAQPEVLINGLISCNEDKDCPEGKICQDNLSCS